jgi:hypothetical protein
VRGAGSMTTISSYLSVSTNIDKWRAIAAKKPDVQLETSPGFNLEARQLCMTIERPLLVF